VGTRNELILSIVSIKRVRRATNMLFACQLFACYYVAETE